MKLVFTADVHLDSAFGAEDKNTRNGELLNVFGAIVSDAVSLGADALILGGDLFDTPLPRDVTAAAVKRIIADSGIRTYAIAGNHDPLSTTAFYSDAPDNMYVFGKDPECVDIGGITLVGASVTEYTDYRNIFGGISVPPHSILLCHGTVGGESGHNISREAVENSGADICLMGHIHKTEIYDWQGVRAIYCGSPAGRGFDELGEHGYYVIDTDTKSFTYRKTNAKIYKEYTVGITDCVSIADVLQKMCDIHPADNEIARAVLTGEVTGEFYIDTAALLPHTAFSEIKDSTAIADGILKNESSDTLEGEFIRILKEKLDTADSTERQKILDAIKEGITLLRYSK